MNEKKSGKKNIKRIFCTVMIVLQILLFVSCENDTAKRTNEISADTVAEIMLEAIGREDMEKLDNNDIEFTLGVSPAYYTEAAVYVCSSGASIDEFGVFKAAEGEKTRLTNSLSSYISSSQAGKFEWLKSYNPPEAEKLEDAYIDQYGDIVVYSFCGDDCAKEFGKRLKSAGIY